MSTILSQPTPYPQKPLVFGDGAGEGLHPFKPCKEKITMAENKTKDKFIKLRVTEDERVRWNAKAAKLNMTLADYFRKLADEEPTGIAPAMPLKNRKFVPVDPELLRQIAWIGNNLNQIAKAVNQGNKTDLVEQLISIDRRLKEIADAY